MWQSIQSFQQHPEWGLYRTSIQEEAIAEQNGTLMAACLSSMEVIRVTGAEAENFLQGQMTCDFKEIASGGIRLGAHCNAKGRVQASFHAVKLGDDFLLLVPKGQGEPTRAALAKYAVFSKVTLTLDTQLLVLALLGNGALALGTQIWGTEPAESGTAQGPLGLLARLDERSLLVVTPIQEAANLLQQLQDGGAMIAGDNPWWLQQLSSGVAQITASLSEEWIPQEFNYDLVDGISFKKGCYKGQEIVARIHYRGQTKVRARILTIEDSQTPTPGTKLVKGNGQNAGSLLQLAYMDEHKILGIGVVKNDVTESEVLRLEPNESSSVHLVAMPYAINN